MRQICFCHKTQQGNVRVKKINFYNNKNEFVTLMTDDLVKEPEEIQMENGVVSSIQMEVKKDSWYRIKKPGQPALSTNRANWLAGLTEIEFETHRGRFCFNVAKRREIRVKELENGDLSIVIRPREVNASDIMKDQETKKKKRTRSARRCA